MNRNATALILIVLAIGIYFTVTRGLLEQVKEVRAVNDEYSGALRNAEELIKVRKKVSDDYNSITDADRQRLDKMVPNTVDNIRLVIDLTSVGLRHGFTLKNIKASAANSNERAPRPEDAQAMITARGGPGYYGAVGNIPTPTLETVTVTFDVVAPYLEFISFLQDLEANLRLMDISRLSVTANEDGLYAFNVELKTYWLKQQ